MVEQVRRYHVSRIILASIACFITVFNIGLLIVYLIINSDSYLEQVLIPLPVDDVPPTIQLRGPEKKTVAFGTKYVDDGVDAYDIRTEVTVETDGVVDTNQVGEYLIKYTATDEHGNSSSVSRIVSVIQPTGVIYLTFDDGPGQYTAHLLDVLKQYNVQATFFVTGYGDDELIRREYDESHTVALHSMSHDYAYIYSSVENYYADLIAVQDRVKRITGETSTLIRFPGGSSNTVSTRYDGGGRIMTFLAEDVANRGFTYFDWNVSSGDAGDINTTDGVYERVVDGLKVGGESVVLQHDVKDFSVDAVERIIQYGLDNGYIFAKLNKDSFTAHHGINN